MHLRVETARYLSRRQNIFMKNFYLKRFIFIFPLAMVGVIGALELLPSRERIIWNRDDTPYSSTPPVLLANSFWTRTGTGEQGQTCDGYWVKYSDGYRLQAYGSAPITYPAEYRAIGNIYEIRSPTSSDYLRWDGQRFIVLDEDFSEFLYFGVRVLTQERCFER